MSPRFRSRIPWHLIGTLLLLTATLAASKLTATRKAESLAQPLDNIARQIAGFTGTDNPDLDAHVLGELKATSYLSRTYRKPGLAGRFVYRLLRPATRRREHALS